jgi:hypothetical protein
MTWAIYKSYLLALHWGRHKTPHNHREMAMNNHQLVLMLLCCSKPSRWWQPPRVTRNPQPQRSPCATRCIHSSKCNRNHSQSHYDDESMMKMSERCLLRLTRMYHRWKCPRGWAQSAQVLFIEALSSKSRWCLRELTRLTDRTHPSVQSGAFDPPNRPVAMHHIITFEFYHHTPTYACTHLGPKIWSTLVRHQQRVYWTGHVRSGITWHALVIGQYKLHKGIDASVYQRKPALCPLYSPVTEH